MPERTLWQNASLAIRDVYDAIVELVTNADDRYQIPGIPGRKRREVIEPPVSRVWTE